MTDNPFASIDYGAAPADKPQQAEPASENPFSQIDYENRPQTSTIGAAGASLLSNIAPNVGAMAGAGYGAEAGSVLGPVGAFAGAVGGGLLGALATSKAQDYGVSRLPHSWQDPITEYQKAAEEQHPTASFLGGLVPMAMTMSPRLSNAVKDLPPDATRLDRILAHPVTARLFSGAVQGGMELGQEKVEGQDADWTHVGIATGFGVLFSRANHYGEAIEGSGAAAARALRFERAPRVDVEAPPPAEPPAAAPPPAAREPTINDARDLKVAGDGIDENVFQGSRLQDETAEMAARDAKRTETALTEPPPPVEPDVTGLVARMEPELIQEHDALIHQRDSLANLAAEQGPESPAAKHLAEVNKAIDETTPQVKAAYEAAAERAGGEVHEPKVEGEVGATPSAGAIPPDDAALTSSAETNGTPSPSPPIENFTSDEQRQWVVDDLTRRWIAAGRPADEAHASARVVAEGYEQWARRTGGKFGGTAEMYVKEHPAIVGVDGKNVPPGSPPVGRTVVSEPATGPAVTPLPPENPKTAPKTRRRTPPAPPTAAEPVEAAPPAEAAPAAATPTSEVGRLPADARTEPAPPVEREPRVGEAPVREPTDTETEFAALDAKDRQIESEKNSPAAIAQSRKMADEAGVTDDIGDQIALWRDPEEAASALWGRDKFWGDHAAFEWTDEKTFSRFVEQVSRSLGAPIDNPGEMERWSTNWFARAEPDLFAKGEGADTAARVAAANVIPNWPDRKVSYIDTAKVEALWARDKLHVAEGGSKGMQDRYKAAQAFIRDLRPGEDLKAPALNVGARGVSFDDGRHRFAAMRDAGMGEIPVSVDAESLKNARRLGLLTRDTAEEAPKETAAAPPAERAPEPAPAPEPTKPAYGAGNKLITADRAAAVRERLKQKLKDAASTTSSGIDPEFLQLGTELAAFHLEAGARSFADFAKAITADLGVKIAELRPYLRSWYTGAHLMMEDHGLDVTGIDPPDVVRTELDSLLREESVNAGPAIHDDGAKPLEEVASAENQGTPGGGNAEREGAASEPGSVGSSGQSDAGRVAAARSGGKGSARSDNASPRKGRVKRAQTIAEEVDAKNPAFSESPSVTERETANVNIPNTDFVLTDELAIGKGTEGEKYADNLAAIRTLKRIEAENRRATPEEKAVLARYVGWGGLKNAFRVAGAAEGEGIAKGWEKRVAELEGLLTPVELRRARNSTTAAHYTSPTVVKAIWQAVDRLGFAGGSVLEPSVGVGNFLGFMPEAARGKSNVFAVEYDSLTARIAQKLYPQADIVQAGFQDVPLPENQFALAIGNPPFGSEKLYFRFNPAVNGKTIHNQFFLNSMRGVRPGGLLAMVVSHNLMDALDNTARLDLARQGKFLGAIRLPDTAFKENARTEVVTDVIFLRKHEAGEEEWAGHAADSLAGLKVSDELKKDYRVERHMRDMGEWVHSNEIDDPAGSGEKINANGYFFSHPDMVVGRINATGKMNRRGGELNVQLDRPEEFQPRLNAAIAKLRASSPREDVAASSLAHYKKMAEGMKLSVERAEPGRIRVDEDGKMKTVIDIDAGEGAAKSVLQEVELTPDTPFKNAYSLNIDGKWQKTADVLDAEGNPKKIMKDGIGRDAQGNPVRVQIPTNHNEKQTVVYDNLKDIPDRDKWGERNVAAVRAMLKIRDAFKAQLQHEMQDAPKEMIEANRAKLNEAYDAFTKEYGTLNDRKNSKLAYSMPDGGLILATEQVDKKGKVSKAAIMSRRVTEPPKVVERAANIGDAVGISLGETGKIDVERIAKLLDTDEAGAIKALSEGEKPRAFFDPETQRWEAADQYLSGLVKKKLLAAKEHGLDANIAALEKVIPADWDASQITPNLGSPWIPPDVIKDFLKHVGYDEAFVDYSPVTNTFSVGFKGAPRTEWATSAGAHSPGAIVEKLLNSKPLKVVHTDNDGKTYVDEEATAESQAKGKELFNEFLDWAYKDDDRRQTLTRVFNDKFNTRVVGQRDGSHLTLPGKVPDAVIRMYRHQLNAIWRGITDRAVLYDHAVGAGKTFTAISRIMERRRMGLSRKPMVVVPNHLVEQWGADITRLYPGANALVAGAEDFKRENRRQLFARIAAGDYDMVVIGHSSFGFINIDPSTEERYLTQELREATAAVAEAQKAADESGFNGFGKPLGVKEAERLVTNIETRLAKIRDAKRDRLLSFEEMGIDDLTVDESHEFKNLAYSSRLQGVSGMGNKAGSGKAMDLHMKVRSLNDRQGTSVAFLTGTPISNSVSEMYLILKNLVPNELKELGIDNFDAWRSMYVDYSSAYEPTEAGGIKEVTRLGRDWTNMKSLMDLYYSVADAVPMSDIESAYKEDKPGREFPIPKVASKVAGGGDREMVAVKPTPEQEEILQDVISGFQSLPSMDLKERNIARLKLMDRARKVSLDARAVDPKIKVAGEGGKISAIVDNVKRIYDKSNEDKGTQIIFLDRSVPKAKGDEKIIAAYDDLHRRLREAVEANDTAGEQKIVEALEKYNANEVEALRAAQNGGWNAYDEIKNQLVAKGIPANEIRFVQEANNDEQKRALFDTVNEGETRVIIGSTPRMGAGTNVQKRLVALHHADVTWKPSDIEQREGRIVRQGNIFVDPLMPDGQSKNPNYRPGFAVDVMAYATERTVDAKMWSLNATKLKAINGIRKYDGSFNMEFEDEESASMAEMAALATGNPLMVERVTLGSQIGKLELAQRSFNRRQGAIRDQLVSARREVDTAPTRAADYRQFADTLEQSLAGVKERSAARSVTVDGKAYNSTPEALAAANQRIEEIKAGDERARFSLEVGGQKFTTKDDVIGAIRKTLGTENFETELGGQKFIRPWEAAQAIERAMQGKGTDFTLDGIKLNGVPVEVDVTPYATSGGVTKQYQVSYSALNAKGQEMAGYRTLLNDTPKATAISAGLDKIAEKLKPESYRQSADYFLRKAAEAEKKMPDLVREVDKLWPAADELSQKRARLQEVIGELSGTKDGKALDDALKGEGEPEDAEAERTFAQNKAAPAPNDTTSPEFKEWFGDSVVTDKDGAPQRMYHATGIWEHKGKKLGDFDTFDRMASVNIVGRAQWLDTIGSWFSDKAGKEGAERYIGSENSGVIYPVYLSIKNPLETTFDALLKEAEKIGPTVKDTWNKGKMKAAPESYENLRNKLIKEGYDGVKITEGSHAEFTGHQVYIAFEPEQIKSAIGNRGTYDKDDPNILHQKAGDTRQGALDIKPGQRSVMRLFQDANASTIMHETAHDWLDKLSRYAKMTEAADDLKEDWGIVKNWLGVKEDSKISRKQHERFARGFEQYLREGVAPSSRLAGVFAQFKNWLMAIYQSAKSLGQPINDDVRGVFDRMLAEHPQKTVIAEERGGPSLASIHEHDAEETPPQRAEQVRDQIIAERDQAAANHPPEIASEIAQAQAQAEAKQQQREAESAGPAGPSPTEPAGQAGEGSGGHGALEANRGESEPVAPGGGGGERSGEVERGGGEAVAEGNGRPAEHGRPVSGRDVGPPVPKPVEQFTAEPGDEFAGNIRVRNVSDEAGVWKLLKDVSENNGDFMGDRNAPQSWGQTVDLADGLGMTVDDLLDRKRGQAFNAAQAWAALQILKTSAHDVWTLAKAVEETGTDEAALAYAEAMSRHGLIQAQFAGITSEAGRTLNIYRAMKAAGEGKLNAINEASKGEASRTLYQIKKEAKLIAQLDDTHKIGKLANDKNKAGFWDHVLEYWINGLISGPTTHVTYSIGNLALAAWKAGPETALAGVIGNLQKAEGSRVHVAESRAQFAGARRGLAPAVANAVQSFREGATLRLPGDKGFDAVMTQTGGMANVDATWKDAAAQTFGLARGLRDAFMGGAALLKAGGIEGEPTWGLRRAGGINPDITIKGVGALPLGTLIRLPSRAIASLHTFFRVLNYSMEKSALAMRQALEEGHEGNALAERAGFYWQNPTEAMMASAARTATEMTLMSTEGEFTRKLAELTNAKFPILNMRALKFIAPFVRISSNVIDQSILQRTPVGLLSESIRNDIMGKTGISSEEYAAGKRNNVAQAKAMSRMIAGSATAMLFGSLAAGGYISGSGPMDRRQAATWRLAGNQAHSVRIGDMWYDMHRLGPLGLLMSTAADMQDVIHKLSDGDALAAGNALWYGITQNILDESFMHGPSDFIKAVDDPSRYGEQYIKQTLASFLPYSVAMAQMARASDPYARQARTVMDEIRRRIPGESENLLPRRDVWGNPIPNPSAIGTSAVTSLYETAVSQDPVNQAMWNIGVFPATLERKIRNVQLTDEQYDQYQVLAGGMAKMRLDAIVKSAQFKTWPAHIQHDVMTETITQSREVARGVMMGRFPEIMAAATQAKMKKATGQK